MAGNLTKQDGRYLELAIAGKSSGDPAIKGINIVGVCLGDTNASGNVVIDTEGIYNLSVKGINQSGNSAVAIGDLIYYVVGDTPVLSKKNTGKLFGIALGTVNSAATATINVKVIPTGNNYSSTTTTTTTIAPTTTTTTAAPTTTTTTTAAGTTTTTTT